MTTEATETLSLPEQIAAAEKHVKVLQDAFRREYGAQTLELGQKLYDRLDDYENYVVNEPLLWDNTAGQNGRVSFWARPLREGHTGISLYLYVTEDGGTSIDISMRPLTYEKTVKLLDAIRAIEDEA